MAILDGVWPEHGQGMPGFREELDDREVAAIGNYVMTAFGGSAVGITQQRVAVLRAGGESSPLLLLARVGIVLAIVLVCILAGLLGRRWRRRRGLA